MTNFESSLAFSYGPKTSLGLIATGPAGQLLLDVASSWESERAKKTTKEEAKKLKFTSIIQVIFSVINLAANCE